MILFSCFRLCHCSFNVKPCNFGHSICANGDGFFEMSGEFCLTVVCNLHSSFLSWLYRILGICWYRASAAGCSLIDNKRLVANIRESERTFLDRTVLGKGTKVIF